MSNPVTRKRRVVRKMKADTAILEFPFQESDVKNLSDTLKEPAWLKTRRLKAWENYRALPMPTLKDEPWRRTDIRGLEAGSLALGPALDVPIEAALLEPLAADLHGSFIGIRPGYDPIIIYENGQPAQGVVFCDWAGAVREHPDILKKYLGKIVRDEEGKFSLLASALARDGILLYVPKGVHVSKPLHSVLWLAGTERSFFSRVLIVVEDGASVTYVHESASPVSEDGQTAHAGIVEIHVGDDAQLTFVELQNLGTHVWNFTHERAQVGRQGRLDWIFGGVGSRLTKNFSEIDLQGVGAEGRMSGFYFADGKQHLDHDTQQNHLAPNTTSDLLFKGALVGRSRSVWQGMIYVAPEAQKTDGYQANRNLILSEQARADSIPGLEILADDVRCTHGATVGQLEEEPIFYLMSRGLSRSDAEKLVVDGFFAPIMERVPFEGVRKRFQNMIDEKLKK
jgi:Fe-S cluster assembly protein SufD